MAAKTFEEWVHNTLEEYHEATNPGGWLKRAWDAAIESIKEQGIVKTPNICIKCSNSCKCGDRLKCFDFNK